MQTPNKINEITKRDDIYSLKSSDNLKEAINKKIKKVFVGALRCIEMRFGDSFSGYEQVRREILRLGNDSSRELAEIIDKSFNVEMIPEIVTIKFVNPEKDFIKERSDEGSETV